MTADGACVLPLWQRRLNHDFIGTGRCIALDRRTRFRRPRRGWKPLAARPGIAGETLRDRRAPQNDAAGAGPSPGNDGGPLLPVGVAQRGRHHERGLREQRSFAFIDPQRELPGVDLDPLQRRRKDRHLDNQVFRREEALAPSLKAPDKIFSGNDGVVGLPVSRVLLGA